MTETKSFAESKFERIREIYVESFPEKVEELRGCWAKINAAKVATKPLQKMREEVHKIAGSSGSHGFDDIHVLARRIEKNIVEVLDKEKDWSSNKETVGNQVQELVNILEQHLLRYSPNNNFEAEIPRLDTLQLSHRELAVFLVSQRTVELSLLSNLLEGRGFSVFSFNDLERAFAMAQTVDPAIVVLDLGDADQITLNDSLKNKFLSSENEVPAFIIISRRDDVDTRLGAARFGAEAFFATPINAHNFSSTLDVILETRGNDYCRVLLIDSNEQRIAYIEKVFISENIKCQVINKVEQVTDKLVNFKPDLVLIAHNLASENSADAARMVRLHESYFNTPIVFLLEEESLPSRLDALRSGADDCISGNEYEQEIFSILKQRIMRFRRANHLIIMDSLTGTLNRDAFFDRASEEISLAIRRNENICLGMIDVDHFKQINDKNGHVVGDYVLRHISDYLNNRLRRSDVVGRYAGDEFLVLLPDTDLDSAYLVLDMIRKNLMSQCISVNNIDVRVSISLGLVATRPSEPVNVESLIVEADKKLYEAKMAGRNTLIAGVV